MMSKLDLPPHLLDQMKEGKAIFFWAEASHACKSADGTKLALTGAQLKELSLCHARREQVQGGKAFECAWATA